MRIPPFLKKGDTIGIIATARKISEAELEMAVKRIEAEGYKVQFAPNLFAFADQFAGTDEQRRDDLQGMMHNPDINAILIARGGYGTMRIIDEINFDALFQDPKWIIGYSDVTVLHSALNGHNMCSLHATMPINFSKNEEATNSLFNVLAGNKTEYSYAYALSENKNLYKMGNVTAPVVGGNLSLLYAMQGSKTDIDTKGKILFLEDLDEYLYHIDRMILSLKRAGKFDDLAGLIIGGMTEMKDNTIPFGQGPEQIIAHHLSDKNYPVCFDFPCGHIDRNLALPLGFTARLEITKTNVSLSYL